VETGAPLVPVALNSGEFWGRNALFKKCGTVTVSIFDLRIDWSFQCGSPGFDGQCPGDP